MIENVTVFLVEPKGVEWLRERMIEDCNIPFAVVKGNYVKQYIIDNNLIMDENNTIMIMGLYYGNKYKC